MFPVTTTVSKTLDWLQSDEAVVKRPVHVPDVLFPNFKVNGLLVLAQWYPFHEWLADTNKAEDNKIIETDAKSNICFFIPLEVWAKCSTRDPVSPTRPGLVEGLTNEAGSR